MPRVSIADVIDRLGTIEASAPPSDGVVPGVPSRCDTDYFRGGASDFSNLVVS